MGNWTLSAWPILASAALKSTLVLGVAFLLSTLLRRRSAAARHIVWTASAAALLALPVLSLVLPAVRVRVANRVLPADTALVFRTSSAAPAPISGAAANTQPDAAPTGLARNVPDRPLTTRDALVLLWTLGLAVGVLQMLAGSAILMRTRRRARHSPDQQTADVRVDDDLMRLQWPTQSGFPGAEVVAAERPCDVVELDDVGEIQLQAIVAKVETGRRRAGIVERIDAHVGRRITGF